MLLLEELLAGFLYFWLENCSEFSFDLDTSEIREILIDFDSSARLSVLCCRSRKFKYIY